jgi:hypothetical protein
MPTPTKFSLPDAIALLSRTSRNPRCAVAWSAQYLAHSNQGKDTWSPFDIVGHLIVGERTDWMPRARIILENGEARPFDPFDRFAQSRES